MGVHSGIGHEIRYFFNIVSLRGHVAILDFESVSKHFFFLFCHFFKKCFDVNSFTLQFVVKSFKMTI